MKASFLAIFTFCGLLLTLSPSEAEARHHTRTQFGVSVGGVVREAYPTPVYVERVPVGRCVRIPYHAHPVVVYPEPCYGYGYETVYVPAPVPVVRERVVYPQTGFSMSWNFFR